MKCRRAGGNLLITRLRLRSFPKKPVLWQWRSSHIYAAPRVLSQHNRACPKPTNARIKSTQPSSCRCRARLPLRIVGAPEVDRQQRLDETIASGNVDDNPSHDGENVSQRCTPLRPATPPEPTHHADHRRNAIPPRVGPFGGRSETYRASSGVGESLSGVGGEQ